MSFFGEDDVTTTWIAFDVVGANDRGMPADWPRNRTRLVQGQAAPDGWQILTEEEFAAYRAARRAVVDAVIVAEQLAQVKAGRLVRLKRACKEYIEARYSDALQRDMAMLLHDASEARAALITQARDWILSVAQERYVRREALSVATSREEVDAVSLDFSSFDVSDPGVNLVAILAVP